MTTCDHPKTTLTPADIEAISRIVNANALNADEIAFLRELVRILRAMKTHSFLSGITVGFAGLCVIIVMGFKEWIKR